MLAARAVIMAGLRPAVMFLPTASVDSMMADLTRRDMGLWIPFKEQTAARPADAGAHRGSLV